MSLVVGSIDRIVASISCSGEKSSIGVFDDGKSCK